MCVCVCVYVCVRVCVCVCVRVPVCNTTPLLKGSNHTEKLQGILGIYFCFQMMKDIAPQQVLK